MTSVTAGFPAYHGAGRRRVHRAWRVDVGRGGQEFFLLTEWSEGDTYPGSRTTGGRNQAYPLDRKRTQALADYLATIHRVKRRDPQLYRRRLRELLSHGECIMGLTDSYPHRYGFITEELLQRIEVACNAWRWRLRRQHARLSHKCMGIFIPGTCCSAGEPTFRCWTARVGSGVSRRTM